MPPKRSAGAHKSASPAKRARTADRLPRFGARTVADTTSRLIAAHHLAEHRGQGFSYLSTRRDPEHSLKTLTECALGVAAPGIVKALQVDQTVPAGTAGAGSTSTESKRLFGWDTSRAKEQRYEHYELRDYIKTLPTALANKLLARVLAVSAEQLSVEGPSQSNTSVLGLATLFMHENTTRLSLSAISAPALLLSKLADCTALTHLDLSSQHTLKDAQTAKVFQSLRNLESVNLRGCAKVGDSTVVALAQTTEHRLKHVVLSMTAVSIKGLLSLFVRCSQLETLKLANMANLGEKAVSKLIDESTTLAKGWRHVPLSRLTNLKLRSTELTDASLGRILTLCGHTLKRLDISYTKVRTLDILGMALFVNDEWQLEKLVASGLPLSPATMTKFFESLSNLPDEQRSRFQTLKLGSIPAASTTIPGLTDHVMKGLLPLLRKLSGLENVSLYQNWELGKDRFVMYDFMAAIGRRCRSLDLTLPVTDFHLSGLDLDSFQIEETEGVPDDLYRGPIRLETLILDNSKVTDESASNIARCSSLRALHVAETKITPALLKTVIEACPRLTTLNLTSCRGVPVAQRRTFFEAYARGETGEDGEEQEATMGNAGRGGPSRRQL